MIGSQEQIDTEVSELRAQLKERRLVRVVKPPSLHQYRVAWRPGGVRPGAGDPGHDEYIHAFCEDFVRGVKRQVSALAWKVVGGVVRE